MSMDELTIPPTLTEDEAAVLMGMDDDFWATAAVMAERTGLSKYKVLKACRSLKDAGLVYGGPSWGEDDGLLRGRGYWLTDLGDRWKRHYRDEERNGE